MNENALNANVGLKLRSLRLARNIKQTDAAKDLGVSPAYLNLIEKGKRVMPFPLLWMQGNEMAHGDPFYPIHVVEQSNADWTREGIARVGEWRYRLASLALALRTPMRAPRR